MMRALFRRVAIPAAGVALLVVAAFSQAATKPRAAASTKGKVLILGTSVDGGSSSPEAQKAAADGFAVRVVSASRWDAMTTKQFKRYRALIIGDNHDSGNKADIQAAISNHNVWGRAISGNIILAGADAEYHTAQGSNLAGAQQYIAKAIAFAAHVPGHTGFYFAGTYYSSSVPQRLTVLDGLKRNGFYWQHINEDNIHIDPAVTPKVHGLSDTTMSNWGETAHEAFTKWPKKTFHVWAVGSGDDPGGNWTTSDHVTGWAQFLVRGKAP